MKTKRVKTRVRAWCQRAAEAGYDAAVRRGWIDPSVRPSGHVQATRVDRVEYTVKTLEAGASFVEDYDNRGLMRNYAMEGVQRLIAKQLDPYIDFHIVPIGEDGRRHYRIIGRLNLVVKR